jgi:hypothetical protein
VLNVEEGLGKQMIVMYEPKMEERDQGHCSVCVWKSLCMRFLD